MKIQFYLRYHTRPGESLYISGNQPALGDGDPVKALPADYLDAELWSGAIELEAGSAGPVRYHYLLKNTDGSVTVEWGDDRVLDLSHPPGLEELQVIDTWNYAGEYENTFFTSPFREILLPKPAAASRGRRSKEYTHLFKVKAPLLQKDQRVCLSGSSGTLGEWDPEAAVMMAPEGNWWVCKLNIPKESFPIAYKYGIYDSRHKKFLHFEEGPNRSLHGDADKRKLYVLHDGFIHLPNNTWRGAGVAIPVFSLRSKKSFGVGEFADLKGLVDWAVKTGLKLIQILPVNDTTATHTWQDSYPYAAISAFALHPLYLSLEKCAGKKYAHLIKPLRAKQKELNGLEEVDYEEVMEIKLSVLRELYELQKDTFESSADYQAFFEQNKHWLIPYAAFCHLREKNGTPDFTQWKTQSRYDREAIGRYAARSKGHYDSIALRYFIQYQLHVQLREATGYAHEQGIVVKGDIPIGVYRHSCDAWVAPDLYHMEFQAGAPPDDFAVKGQNWGFPTYHWERMEKDGFAWWKQRFEQMSLYFDAFRIDHILGFFRIWSIPTDAVEGILGHFVPAIPVYRHEFNDRNIWFDRDRYTRPFINDAVLWELFNEQSDAVKQQYLEDRGDGSYALREAFDTQRKVQLHFEGLGDSDFNKWMRQGLFDLIANILLLEEKGSGGEQFHFRIAMEHTSSFRYLEWNEQQLLRELYRDYFFGRQDHFWYREAMNKLPALKRATNMLVCGEDLGMVPACVPEVMRQLGILSLEIQRMPKNSSQRFSPLRQAPYLSVVTPSTHDMSTIRGWWEEDRSQTQQFFNGELEQWGEAPYFCEPWINRAIVLQHLHAPAMWSIFQLQDLMGMSEEFRRENPHDERINVPANSHYYWRYRMHILLEDLLKQKAFNEELKRWVESSGR